VGGWSEAEGPKGNTACGHRADHENKETTSAAPWGDEAKRKVRGTTPLATTTSTMKKEEADLF